jgi:hypothetical protein
VGAESELRQSRADPLSYLLLRFPEKSKHAHVPRFILIRIITERRRLALVTELQSFGNIFCTVEVASISDFSCVGAGDRLGADLHRVDDTWSASKEEFERRRSWILERIAAPHIEDEQPWSRLCGDVIGAPVNYC